MRTLFAWSSIQSPSFILHLPLRCKLYRRHVFDGRVNSFLVVVCKSICQDLFGLLITGKFMPPQVFLFESLVEWFHVTVLLWCVLLDELMFYAKYGYCFSKTITSVLRAVVGSKSQSGTIWIFYRYCICYRVNGHLPCSIYVKCIGHPSACKAVHHIKAVAPSQ